MRDSQNTILPDHQEKLDEIFEHIHYLIDNDKIDNAKQALLDLHHADLADFLDTSSYKLYDIILPIIADDIDPQTLVWLSDSHKQYAIEALGIDKAVGLINNLDIEDSIEVIDALSLDLKDEIIGKLKNDNKQQIIEGFKYPEDTVGRIVEKHFVAFQKHWSVGQAIEHIRKINIDREFHAGIVVNDKYQPVGNILLCTLLKSTHDEPLINLMNSDFKIADTGTKLDEIAFIFKQYALTIVPVVNKKGKLVGSVSIDNMIYIIEEQTESEFMHLGGINNSDIFDNLYATVKHRFPWLFINLITAFATSLVINQFSDTIEKLIILATIMPIVASMGGNAGTQVMTVTVIALANREIKQTYITKVILKEVFVCLLNGLILAIIGALIIYIPFSDLNLTIVFTAAVIINFAAAGMLGSSIPIIFDHFDIDPATSSGVVLTALTDALGFFSFLGLAFFFLV
jgi:magnesium transporter